MKKKAGKKKKQSAVKTSQVYMNTQHPQFSMCMEVACTIAPTGTTMARLLASDFAISQSDLRQLLNEFAAKHGMEIAMFNNPLHNDNGRLLSIKPSQANDFRRICNEYWSIVYGEA